MEGLQPKKLSWDKIDEQQLGLWDQALWEAPCETENTPEVPMESQQGEQLLSSTGPTNQQAIQSPLSTNDAMLMALHNDSAFSPMPHQYSGTDQGSGTDTLAFFSRSDLGPARHDIFLHAAMSFHGASVPSQDDYAFADSLRTRGVDGYNLAEQMVHEANASKLSWLTQEWAQMHPQLPLATVGDDTSVTDAWVSPISSF